MCNKEKVVARSYLYQTSVPTAETEVTFSSKTGKIRNIGQGQASTHVALLPQRKPQYKDHKHVEEDDDTKHLLSSTDSYNFQYRERGVFYTNGKENGNNNNGNGVNLGANKYAKDAISLNSPVLSKTPLPVIGGKHPIYSNTINLIEYSFTFKTGSVLYFVPNNSTYTDNRDKSIFYVANRIFTFTYYYI